MAASRTVVQYVAVRSDLLKVMKWPLGAVIAQACHASIAAIAPHNEVPSVKSYIHEDNLATMHKVVLEVPSESELRALSDRLTHIGVAHHLWVEQPEGIATALATMPDDKNNLHKHFKHLKLFK